MISVANVHAAYGDGPDVLKGVSLEAGKGEIVSILGPNGCGKSTLLKCIAGYLPLRRGTVSMLGRDVGGHPVFRKVRELSLGYVPQSNNVFSNLTVEENLCLGAQWLPRADRKQAVEAAVARYPALGERARDKASSLSGGERQLLSLGRALASRPSVLLLDEPSAGLSPRVMTEVFDEIARLRSSLGLSILLVEQNAVEALRISDRAYVLVLGEVAHTGPASELRADPGMSGLYLGIGKI